MARRHVFHFNACNAKKTRQTFRLYFLLSFYFYSAWKKYELFAIKWNYENYVKHKKNIKKLIKFCIKSLVANKG